MISWNKINEQGLGFRVYHTPHECICPLRDQFALQPQNLGVKNIQPFHTIYNITTLDHNLIDYFIATRLGDNTSDFRGDGLCNDLYWREGYL